MIQLRLFRAAEPFQQLEQRSLEEGEMTIGRDASAHWMIADETCELSRRHCTISLGESGPVLRDTSTNGVFIGDERTRAPRGAACALAPYETLHLGQYLIVLEPLEAVPANDVFETAHLFQTVLAADALVVRSDWDIDDVGEAANDRPPLTDAALLEAFCLGAGLDPSSFAGEDPATVLERAGAMYKQMVLGVGDLLSERHLIKADFNMDRTKVGAEGNNPFKWAPTRRVAVDLLRAREDGFLWGPAAVRASFSDLKKHTMCLMSGSRASVDHALRSLAPQLIEAESVADGALRLNKSDSFWRTYQRAHTRLADEEASDGQASLNRAFKAGYERRLREFEEADTKS